jgi:hypothetical protein
MNFDFVYSLLVGSLFSLFTGSLLVLGYKYGLITFLQLRSPNKFFDKMLSCNYCMSHHILFIVTASLLIAGVIPFNNPINYFIPLAFAPVINKIV